MKCCSVTLIKVTGFKKPNLELKIVEKIPKYFLPQLIRVKRRSLNVRWNLEDSKEFCMSEQNGFFLFVI